MRTPARPPGQPWSLALKLPLLLTAFLAVTLVVVLALTYVTLARSARAAAQLELARVASQLSSLAAESVARQVAAATEISRDPTVRTVLSDPSTLDSTRLTVVREQLERLIASSGTTLVAGLWSADGRLLTSVGGDSTRVTLGVAQATDGPMPVLPGVTLPDTFTTATHSDLYLTDGTPTFWSVVPVAVGGHVAGYIARQHRISGGVRAETAIRGLTGDDIDPYYRDVDGGVWITVAARAAAAPVAGDTVDGIVMVTRPGIGQFLTSESPIPGAPLVFVTERSEESVLAAPRASIRRLAAVSVVILMVGAVVAWLASRRITRPLVALTSATTLVARGAYNTRVNAAGAEELVSLAGSFNRMAAEVGAAHDELEAQTEEAQATAEELAMARAEADGARIQAETANRAKSDFLAVMSHELRTPLNAIGGYTELLELGLRGPLTDAQRRDLERIRVNQQHLLGLIGAVLDLSRIETGRVAYNITPVLLSDFLTGLNGLVEPQAIAKSLDLEYRPCDSSLVVLADREKLRQVMLNLLSNAIRYTPAGGRVVLSAAAIDGETGAMVAISVRDTGVGIPAGVLEDIFQPFVQLDRSLTQVREGVGLGLAISLDLARGMGGDIVVESRVGEGSSFTVTLPRAGAPEESPEVV